MSSKPTHLPDSIDAFTRIENLARDAKAMPGLRNDALLQIVNVSLKELGLGKANRMLGAPPESAIRAAKGGDR
jgi:hypothetical protein